MKRNATSCPCTPRRHRGVALIISLILLVVVTMLGLAAIRSITQEERMAGYSLARSLAFQATESALRSAEVLVETHKPQPATCDDSSGVMTCPAPLPTATPRWEDNTFTDWSSLPEVGSGVLAITPQYFVEYLGSTFPCNPIDIVDNLNCKRYRITARSAARGGNATAVMLQSVYATD